jgi:L,D-transpeptidase catalytic domain
LVAAAVVTAALLGSDRSPARVGKAAAPLPAPPASPFRLPAKATPLADPKHLARWLPILRSVTARAAPDARAPVVARLGTRTPEDTTNIVLALRDRVDPAGKLWIEARLPVLPNGTKGWIPRSALGGNHFVRTHLVVDRDRFTATLLRDGRPVFRARIGVGKRDWPTPQGRFYIRNKLTSFRSAIYGPLAFGTSARSSTLTDWPAGGFIGIHGTDHPELLPGRVSHGCIRMRNADIVRLARLMPFGTPLTIT